MPAVVALEPLSLIGLRQRDVGLLIAGVGLFALLTLCIQPHGRGAPRPSSTDTTTTTSTSNTGPPGPSRKL